MKALLPAARCQSLWLKELLSEPVVWSSNNSCRRLLLLSLNLYPSVHRTLSVFLHVQPDHFCVFLCGPVSKLHYSYSSGCKNSTDWTLGSSFSWRETSKSFDPLLLENCLYQGSATWGPRPTSFIFSVALWHWPKLWIHNRVGLVLLLAKVFWLICHFCLDFFRHLAEQNDGKKFYLLFICDVKKMPCLIWLPPLLNVCKSAAAGRSYLDTCCILFWKELVCAADKTERSLSCYFYVNKCILKNK